MPSVLKCAAAIILGDRVVEGKLSLAVLALMIRTRELSGGVGLSMEQTPQVEVSNADRQVPNPL